MASPGPTRPPAPAIALPDLEPLESEIVNLMSCNGGNREAAVHGLRMELHSILKLTATAAPEVLAKIMDARDTAHKKLVLAVRLLRTAHEDINGLRNRLHDRANLLFQVADDTARLESIRAQLASPEIVNVSPADQFALSNLEKHLPATIAEAQRKADELRDEIASLTDPYDLAAIVAGMYAGTKNERGAVLDARTRSLHDRGFFKLK
jgi:hypothetical protein